MLDLDDNAVISRYPVLTVGEIKSLLDDNLEASKERMITHIYLMLVESGSNFFPPPKLTKADFDQKIKTFFNETFDCSVEQ